MLKIILLSGTEIGDPLSKIFLEPFVSFTVGIYKQQSTVKEGRTGNLNILFYFILVEWNEGFIFKPPYETLVVEGFTRDNKLKVSSLEICCLIYVWHNRIC
jgi:hypothetical protein